MKYIKEDDSYVIRLENGEPLIATLVSFAEKEMITSAFLQGIGAADATELGFYNLVKKEYIWQKFENAMEVVSIGGNIATVEGSPFVHLHAVLSDDKFNCYGGHVKELRVGATCEIVLRTQKSIIKRSFDEKIGLKLLDCDRRFLT